MQATFSLVRTKNNVGMLAKCKDPETAEQLEKLFGQFLQVIEEAAKNDEKLCVTHLIP